jgi:glycosyltransferase involved in cell wall biosynthesis
MAVAQLPKTMKCEPAERRLRIAMVYSRLPFPMMRGDQLTVAHLISFLAQRGHAIDLYDMALDGKLDDVQKAWLERSCRSVRCYDQGRPAKLFGLAKGLVSRLPLQIGLFDNRKLAADLRAAIGQGEYDIVYCYYPRTAPAIPNLVKAKGRTKSFLALQLSQTLNTERMARNETNLLKKLVFHIEAKLMGRFESRIWRDFNRVVLIGPADVAAVRAQCAAHGQPDIDNWVYGAHGTDTDKYVPARPEEVVRNRIVFSGSMLYPPNIQAVQWFVANVWPRIRTEVPDATFIVQGRDPSSEITALDGRDGIHVTGTVPDVGVIIRSAHVCVNPMLAAGGMQNKLIEYMACGKAVVASSIANEGIMAPDEALLIADDAEAFAAATLRLLRDPEESRALAERARAYVLANWTWEKHFLDLESAFYQALDEDAAAQ